MRLGAGSALIGHSCAGLAAGASLGSGAVQALSALPGLLLVAGLWTPAAGLLAAAAAAWNAYASPGDAEFHALIAAIAHRARSAWPRRMVDRRPTVRNEANQNSEQQTKEAMTIPLLVRARPFDWCFGGSLSLLNDTPLVGSTNGPRRATLMPYQSRRDSIHERRHPRSIRPR